MISFICMVKFFFVGYVLLKSFFGFLVWMFYFMPLESFSFRRNPDAELLISFDDLWSFLDSMSLDNLVDVFSFVKKQLFFCCDSGFSFRSFFSANNIEYEHSYLFSSRI